MEAVITGDIINSRKVDPSAWISILKELFQKYGTEPKNWEIYRGDSFQLVINAHAALEIAILNKSAIKKIDLLDIRMAIRLGEIEYRSERIT